MAKLPFGVNIEIEDLFKCGKWTHVAGACGIFSETASQVKFGVLPGGRIYFDLASLTKALVTAPLVLRDLNAKKLSLESTVEMWLGTKASLFKNDLKELKVKALLNHTSGLPAWRNLWLFRAHKSFETSVKKDRQFLLDYFNQLPFSAQNARTVYSDLGYIFLGLCLELLHEKSLPLIFYGFCQKELALENPDLFFQESLQDKPTYCVPTSYCKIRRRWLVGEVHDENCYSLNGVAGHAGLFGSLEGVVSYLERLVKVFKEELSTAFFAQDQMEFSAIGWKNFLVESDLFKLKFLGHLGFTGTSFWVEPTVGFYGVLLTNRVISSRKPSWIQSVRKEILGDMWNALHREKYPLTH